MGAFSSSTSRQEVLVVTHIISACRRTRSTNVLGSTTTSYEECLERSLVFKHYVDDQDGWRLLNQGPKRLSREADVQLFFGLLWQRTEFDINREPNNGRGPVDFKASYGAGDKTFIEIKLASNSSLKRNLEKQVEIYVRPTARTRSSRSSSCTPQPKP